MTKLLELADHPPLTFEWKITTRTIANRFSLFSDKNRHQRAKESTET
jgi:hypothetical protein